LLKLIQCMELQGPLVITGFVCRISEDIMRDAVVCADGRAHDPPNIHMCFAGGHDATPNTRPTASSH
jgi:hypothetical protein